MSEPSSAARGADMVRAPYNFVPFSNKILAYPERPLPRHDRLEPTLRSGEIHVTLTAETPVFIQDGGAESHFFRNARGVFTIPGSSLRGVIRENMQILGFGLVRPGEDFEDTRILFRDVASGRSTVQGELHQYYQAAMKVESIPVTDRDGRPVQNRQGRPCRCSVPLDVQAGYLRKAGGRYEILPAQVCYSKSIHGKETSFRYLRVSRGKLPGGDRLFAQAQPVAYRDDGAGNITEISLTEQVPAGMKRGTLLATGRAVGEPNHLYVIPEEAADADPVPLAKEDVLAYAADWENRKNSLKGGNYKGKTLSYDVNFWKLPEDGERKPVFYLRYEGHTYFGMSRFLRIGYRHTLAEGLPDKQRETLSDLPEEKVFLDYPHAIMGYARKDDSYRSRVSFGDFPALGGPREMERVKTVLGGPKTSYYPGYVKEGKHYNDDDFQLRGYKQYWLKKEDSVLTDKEPVASILRPLPVGTRFRGVIRFQNLYEDELGLLLWALRLEDGCRQSVGMGKPYGFGRVKLEIDSLREYHFAALYSPEGFGGGAEARDDTDAAVERYINAYREQAASALFQGQKNRKKKRKSLMDTPELKAFFYLRRTIRESDEVRYMRLEEYRNIRKALPDVAAVREAEESSSAADAELSDEERIKALRDKFKPL